jgi:nitrite reductase/ring-hydroxylating ferredoxin subunit
MNRLEFLKSIGFKGAALMALITSCVREEDTYVTALTLTSDQANGNATTTLPTTPISTTQELGNIKNPLLKIDLTNANAVKLQTAGGYLVQSGIVVARVSQDTYAAATQTCTHEPKKQVIFSNSEFYCTAHGARFSVEGKGLNSLGNRGLTIYKVATDGKTLIIYS